MSEREHPESALRAHVPDLERLAENQRPKTNDWNDLRLFQYVGTDLFQWYGKRSGSVFDDACDEPFLIPPKADTILSPRGEQTEAVRGRICSILVRFANIIEDQTPEFRAEALGRFADELTELHPAGAEAPSVVQREVLERVEGRASSLERIGATVDASDLRTILAALSPQALGEGHGSSPDGDTHRAQETPVVGWQPIETAPKQHGQLVLLATKERGVVAGSWGLGRYDRSTKDYERAWTDGVQTVVTPTHWMPLPPAPSPTAGDE